MLVCRLLLVAGVGCDWSSDKDAEQILEQVGEFLRLPQSLVFAWICCNLFQNEAVARRAMDPAAGAFAASLCMVFGLGAENLGTEGGERA